MDIEKLIKEEKKTQEFLLRLEKAGTLEKMVEDINKRGADWYKNPFSGCDNWDYDTLNRVQNVAIRKALNAIYDNLVMFKFCHEYIKDLYESRTKEWENWKKENPNGDYYKNPKCLKFFEDYEKHNKVK